MPKTGGTFVTKVLEELHEGGKYGIFENTYKGSHETKHQRYEDIEYQYGDRLILTTIRSPFDYYVSIYEFGWWKTHPDSMFIDDKMKDLFPVYPELDFEDFIKALNNFDLSPTIPPFIADLLKRSDTGYVTFLHINYFCKRPWKVFEGYFEPNSSPKKCIERINRDSFSPEKNSTFQNNEIAKIHFANMHNLNEELYNFLLNLDFDPNDIEFIKRRKKILPWEGGRSENQDWRNYYSPTSKKYVSRKEAKFFLMFPEFEEL